mgnify:CR=1 FL=1|tara:strand:- start:57 stop:767 length:711 start_codon:yes stop_codon:yes gene_type:complete
MGICKICRKEKKLIKKSHIISKLLFRDLFEYNPRKSIIQFDILNSKKPVKKPSDSLYDNGLFCAQCDGDDGMAIFEDYFKKYITNPKFTIEKKSELDWIIYSEYDYDKFFLFFNIQIYRASLSKRDEFKMVTLNEKILEKIRVNIVNRKITEKTNEIAIIKFSENSNFKNSIGSFRKIDDNYFIILRDFIVFYFFNKKDTQFLRIKGHIIKKEKLIIPIIPKKIEKEFIKSIIGIK